MVAGMVVAMVSSLVLVVVFLLLRRDTEAHATIAAMQRPE